MASSRPELPIASSLRRCATLRCAGSRNNAARAADAGDHARTPVALQTLLPILPEDLRSSHPSAGGSFRALLTFASIALIAVYVVYVQRSAEEAMSRATAAERTAAELQRTAHDAVTASSDRAQRAISEALTHAARAERMIEVIAAPDSRRIELSGRTAAPGAIGHALYSRSRGVIVSATDMPPPAEGHVFQVWATTATGSVSLGLAAPDAQGRLAAAYELPRDLAGPIRGFLVTQEQVGGSESPGVAVIANR